MSGGPPADPAVEIEEIVIAVLREDAARGRAAQTVLGDDGDRRAAVGNFGDARGELMKGHQDRAWDVAFGVLAFGAHVEHAKRLAHGESFIELVGLDGLESIRRMHR